MVSATTFNTRNETFRRLMGNGLSYRVPPFQRDYSWTVDEWEDLWSDILGTIGTGGEAAHYMGFLVLQSDDGRTFDLIDGQQRLTTLSLVVLAVLRNLQRLIDHDGEPESNRRRLDQLRQNFIGYLDPVSLVPRSKLMLNRNSDFYYQTFLVPLVEQLPQIGFGAAELALRRAFNWFDDRVGEYARAKGGDPGIALASFVETMSDSIFFTVVSVADELDAYNVFETLNARGVRLSATDLLKNYLFSVLDRAGRHPQELRSLQARWEAILGRLGPESFPEYLRAHWRSRRAPVRQTDLFKTIRRQVTSPAHVFALMRELEDDLDAFFALTRPERSDWPPDWRDLVATLRLFDVRLPLFPLLLTANRRLDSQAFGQVLRAAVVVSFRYNVIGDRSPGEQERVYDAAIRDLLAAERPRAAEVFAALTSIYPADAEFRAAFAAKSIRTTDTRANRLVRYILGSLERRLSGTDPDVESDALSVEHVLPRHPEEGWDEFPANDLERFVYRLGNMTLLETGRNRDLGTADYETKRAVYAASAFAITRAVAEHNAEWTPARLEQRQRWMANQATAIWHVAQLAAA